MKKIYSLYIFVASLFFVTGCTKEEDKTGNDSNLNRKELLTNYTDSYILPAYDELKASLTTLETATDSFIASPDETNLLQLRNMWKAAYIVWQRTDLLEFGPAEDVSLRMYLNVYPTSPSKINANIQSGYYNLDAFGNNDAQGFPAMDYLLNGSGSSDAEIVALYSTDPLASQRTDYLKAIVSTMSSRVTDVRNEWDDYKSTFVNATGTDVNSSISVMTNAFVLYYERFLRSTKVGIPAGAMTGVALPEQTETNYRPELARELLLTALEAVNSFYEGYHFHTLQNGVGMKDYLATIGTKDENGVLISDIISTELEEAKTAVGTLNGTIKDAAQNNRPALLSVYDQLQDLVPLFKVDMVSAFGISITYVDNDGD